MVKAGKFTGALGLMDYLEQHNWAEANGFGRDGIVYWDKSNREAVIKVGSSGNKSKPALEFLQYCEKEKPHQRNSLFPIVYKTFEWKNDEPSWIAILEYLDPAGPKIIETLKAENSIAAWELLMYLNEPEHQDYNKMFKYFNKIGITKENYEMMRLIIKKRFGTDYIDSHAGNFGYRKNGQIVFFDPV